MREQLYQMLAGLADMGCPADAVTAARALCRGGQYADLIRLLRRCRCDRMDALHRSQKQVDCLDYLIRQAEKTQKSERKDGTEP